MNSITSLQNHFLIAMPASSDPNFSESVVYICEHTLEGALGFVVNRPLNLNLQEVLEQMEIQTSLNELRSAPVYSGGPVQVEKGFILHRTTNPDEHWETTMSVCDDIMITTSKDILTAIANGQGPEDYSVLLGYSGWGAGQLEAEIADNVWLVCNASSQVIFDLPCEQRWQAAANILGVDLNNLSNEAGHA